MPDPSQAPQRGPGLRTGPAHRSRPRSSAHRGAAGHPVLILHGGADPVTPPAHARELAAGLPRATLGVLREGLHDVLNDASHRTTAAAVVLWLERLRADPGLRPILTVETGDL